jgi:hypothetical protein
MILLLVKCPTTDQEFSTGITIDESNLKYLPDLPTKARCPHCGLGHVWRLSEARWTEDFQSPRTAPE